MKVKSVLDKRVLDNILAMAGKSPRVYQKLIDFIRSCNEVQTYDGMWLKKKNSSDILRLLNPDGKLLRKIDSSTKFTELTSDSEHFTLSITTDDTQSLNSPTPVLTLDNLHTRIKEIDQTAFYIKNRADFCKASFLHQPTSVLINDRYFFNDENPAETLIILLKNLLPADFQDTVVITIFCSLTEDKNEYLVKDLQEFSQSQKSFLEKETSAAFSETNFIIEIFECRKHNITHDRFLFTDMLCYKSEKSFQFIPNNESGTINLFPIYEGPNFKANLAFLTDYLSLADKRTLLKSKNPIIKSFLGKKEAEAVI